jgi:hypothetical protein
MQTFGFLSYGIACVSAGFLFGCGCGRREKSEKDKSTWTI